MTARCSVSSTGGNTSRRRSSRPPACPWWPVARLLAPIPQPRRNLFAVGKNYREHVGEFGRPDYDGHGPLRGHPGRSGRAIPREQALDHVWGYTVVHDVTARDLQWDHKQWLLGKSLDTFAPMGPWAVTADEVGDPTSLVVSSTVNREPLQKATVADLIFDIPKPIRVISVGITLLPGDIIATGTPAGVGTGSAPPRFLAPGDVVECAINRPGRAAQHRPAGSVMTAPRDGRAM
jgi:2-keto-4-pentenoate hydratase/2-oxohepta-3-ene-1,7-dioic acid hydratase in catechol pathway